ncbi:MAG TPA: hypothetical protein VFT66_12855 [Roseiflexaceae bacterium]|nr:hypothetical protein [Roseiflexaceae bacterium]
MQRWKEYSTLAPRLQLYGIIVRMQLVHMPPDASEDEVAAALVAVACVLEEHEAEQAAPARSAWSAAAALEVQRMPATRNGAFSTWGSVERSRRAARWSKGLVGL